ncbi:MAG: DUF1624 domain-containing protein [Gammaproteobacteria bacterium]
MECNVRSDAQPERRGYVDVFRGLLITHMALDHASLMLNAGRGGEELAAAAPAPYDDLYQFLTRFTGAPVAPGFFFMAGFMVALTSIAREHRGVSRREVTRRLLIRGLALIAADTIIMGLPRAMGGFYSFVALSSVGVGLILLALVRSLPSRVLLPLALAILVLHSLLDVSALPLPLRAVLYEPIRTGAFRSLYPVIPWCAIVLVGFVAGRDAARRIHPARFWLGLAAACLIVFLGVRLNGGYGNAYSYHSVASCDFWSFAVIFLALAVLRTITRLATPALLRPFVILGRVPFFFYILHFYVLGVGAAVVQTKLGLGGTYLVWLLLLILMAWPCVWYCRKKLDRPNLFTRYL